MKTFVKFTPHLSHYTYPTDLDTGDLSFTLGEKTSIAKARIWAQHIAHEMVRIAEKHSLDKGNGGNVTFFQGDDEIDDYWTVSVGGSSIGGIYIDVWDPTEDDDVTHLSYIALRNQLLDFTFVSVMNEHNEDD